MYGQWLIQNCTFFCYCLYAACFLSTPLQSFDLLFLYFFIDPPLLVKVETILPETAWMAYWPGLGLGIGYFAKHPTIFLNIAGNILRAGVMDRH